MFKKHSVPTVMFWNSITCRHAGEKNPNKSIINGSNPSQIIKMKALLCMKAEINFIRGQKARDLILRKFSTLSTEAVKRLPEWMPSTGAWVTER